jgi:hypothetical protein
MTEVSLSLSGDLIQCLMSLTLPPLSNFRSAIHSPRFPRNLAQVHAIISVKLCTNRHKFTGRNANPHVILSGGHLEPVPVRCSLFRPVFTHDAGYIKSKNVRRSADEICIIES